MCNAKGRWRDAQRTTCLSGHPPRGAPGEVELVADGGEGAGQRAKRPNEEDLEEEMQSEEGRWLSTCTRHMRCRAGCPPPQATTCQDKRGPLSCTLTADPNRKEQRKRMYLIGCSSRAGRWNQNTSFVRWFARQPRHTCLHGGK